MENKLKNLLFTAIECGKIEKFTRDYLKLECHGSTIIVSWVMQKPKDKIEWHNLHKNPTYLINTRLTLNPETTMSYQITFENDLTYDVPMTVVESDKITSLLSDAFQKYQEHVIDSVTKHWEVYSKPDEFDDLLEEPTHVD
jgi:hypothetical protein